MRRRRTRDAEPAEPAELPRVARLWPELAGVPFDRVVAQALAEGPLYQGAALVVAPLGAAAPRS